MENKIEMERQKKNVIRRKKRDREEQNIVYTWPTHPAPSAAI